MTQVMQKVTAFVTRQGSVDEAELLVFQHPTAGVQLPAGTVEAGESLEAAAYREVAEETGLTAVQLLGHLATQEKRLDADQRALLKNTPFLIGPRQDASPLNFVISRGNWLHVRDEVDGYAEVVFEETNLNTNPPSVLNRFSGWLPTEILTDRMERAFFHFEPTAPTREKWDQAADKRIFSLYWIPLVPKPRLVDGQKEWLDLVYETLLARLA